MDIVIVEDERLISLATSRMVESLGHKVLARVPSGEEAVQTVGELQPDLVLMDIHLQGEMDGIEAGETIARQGKTMLVYTTAYTDADTRSRAEATRPLAFLAKPLSVIVLRKLLENIAVPG